MRPVRCCWCGNKSKDAFLLHDYDLRYLECLFCSDLLEVRDFDLEGIRSTTGSNDDERHSGTSVEHQPSAMMSCECGVKGLGYFMQVRRDGELLMLQCPKCRTNYSPQGRRLEEDDRTSNVQIAVDPCECCGNNHPEAFVIEECKGSEDIVLRCMKCDYNQQTIRTSASPIMQSLADVKCDGCDNEAKELFQVNLEKPEDPTVMCLVCYRKKAAATETGIWCEDCGNKNPKQFEVRKNQIDQILEVLCLGCKRTTNIHNDAHPLSHKPNGDDPIRKQIHSVDELRMGDHVEFLRGAGYRHHALVIDVGKLFGKVLVIHFNGEPGQSKTLAEVREDWLEFDFKDPVHVVQYHQDQCFKPLETIRRARERLGEKAYSVITNNCEHFVRWAKTGKETSLQVKEFCKKAGRAAMAAGIRMAPSVAATFYGEVLESAAHVSGLSVFDAISGGIIVAFKMVQMYDKISDAKQQLQHGVIKPNEYRDAVAETVIKGTSETVCTVGGMLAGHILLPIPFVGAVVGATLGSLLGQAGGYLLHGAYTHME